MLSNIRIILVEPTHPGNIGAAARAMKTMGLGELYLVNPQCGIDQQAIRMAAGADDVLQQANTVATLQHALQGIVLSFGTSARQRSLPWPLCSPRECADQIVAAQSAQVALVFGREHAGLTNDELALCQTHVHIDTNEAFSSLNLAAAVQVLCYDCRVACQAAKCEAPEPPQHDPAEAPATSDELAGLMDHFKNVLIKLNILDPSHPKLLLRRLYRMFHRARLKKIEINILRGILKAMDGQ